MYFTSNSKVVVDYDLDLLRHILGAVDASIDEGCLESASSSDPDSFGVFDRLEHVTGLGFVACQTYLAATYSCSRLSKEDALKLGPKHSSGLPIVALLNHAANFWKHHDEWTLQKNTKARDRIIDAFEALGCPALGDYPLSGCLVELCGTDDARFNPIIAHLISWRDALPTT